jgi:anti-sigma regulatory factor (Ser/Thr protein kinase)
MNATATSTQTAGLRLRRVPVATRLAAVSEARAKVRRTVAAWQVPVDPDVVALLTSELVTNAIRHEVSSTVTVAVRCSSGQLRVEVHDSSRDMPAPADANADAESGRGLIIVAALADEWGFYPTQHGKAVYFTLAFQGR